MKSIYYREQKHICGKSYATAPYMEVDLYPVTPKQHKASRRAKRKEASTLAQQTYNDNRAPMTTTTTRSRATRPRLTAI